MRRMILFALALAAGCGPARPAMAPVSGLVSYMGQPLPRGTVTFIPDTPGPTASGEIGTDGRYRLTTYDANDGAVLGKHKVAVAAMSDAGRSRLPEARPQSKPLVPHKYTDFTKSGLTAEVVPGSNTVDLKLE